MGTGPSVTDLAELHREAAGCTRCDLYRNATQVVTGAGPSDAELMLVGEQPGDQEDRTGEPFVGPAGALLDRALARCGGRDDLYVTNAVKHFKWVPRGKRRLHQTPNQTEVVACRPWLEQELVLVRPSVVVALGATAGKALLGPAFRVTRQRGIPLQATVGAWHGAVVGTVHPSAILRITEPDDREREFSALVEDLQTARALLGDRRS